MCRLIINIKRCYNRSMAKKLKLEECNEKYWDVHQELIGKTIIINKFTKVVKTATGKTSKHTTVEIMEISSGKIREMAWGRVTDPEQSGTHPDFDCYDKNQNQPNNIKLCPTYLCRTKTYGDPCTTKFYTNEQGFLTFGILGEGNTTKSRYGKNNLKQQICLMETYNCRMHEKTCFQNLLNMLARRMQVMKHGNGPKNVKTLQENYF